MSKTPALIVGAGPTGLALALFLAKAGVTPRLVDTNSGPGEASRAMAVQARTLEFYRQLGFGDEVAAAGIPIQAIQMYVRSRPVAQVSVAEIGEGISPYPFILSYPQDDHERLLVKKLEAAGIAVEWNTELTAFQDTGTEVQATLRRADGSEDSCAAAFLCGCDGAHSAVRDGLGLGFGGGTYAKTFFVADVAAGGEAAADHAFSFCLDAEDFLLVLPVRSTGMHRLIGVIPQEFADKPNLAFEDLRPFCQQIAPIHVDQVNWFSTYRVHHRVADHFRQGRAFLLGDAGHVHSPAGGQGMNTGIGDAVNLAWKLAAVLQGRAAEPLLDTYETERIAFARSLVATTDKMFQMMSGSGVTHQAFREHVFPHLMPHLLGFHPTRTAAFRLVSQTRIHYPDSPLSAGKAGDVHGGDRLPWVALSDGLDNFAPLQSLDWQIHVYGEAKQPLKDAAREAALPLHEFSWTEAMAHAGLKQNALYLVRPDGYVGLTEANPDAEKLKAYLSRFQTHSRRTA